MFKYYTILEEFVKYTRYLDTRDLESWRTDTT